MIVPTRTDVVRSATKTGALISKGRGQSEISNLDSHVSREEHVAQLQVSVQNALAVDVVTPGGDLEEVVFHLGLGEELSHLGDVEQSLLGSQLQDHVDKMGIFEGVVELDDVDVGHHLVDPDLPLNLLPSPRFPPSLLGV